MLSRLTAGAIPLFLSLSSLAATPSVDDLTVLLAECAPGVDPGVMLPIVQHESGRSQFAIGLNSKTHKLPRQPRTQAEAIATADWLLERGFSFDSGLGQVNSKNMPGLGLSTADLFEPCKNLQGASVVFTDCYERAAKQGYAAGRPATDAALSCYNTGNFTAGIKNGYVGKVKAVAATLDVPALQKESPVAAPVKLIAAQPAPANITPQFKREGISDAFGQAPGQVQSNADAFAPVSSDGGNPKVAF